jgi:hypothetical protein
MKRRPTSLVCTAAIWAEICRHLNPIARPGNTFRPATTLLCRAHSLRRFSRGFIELAELPHQLVRALHFVSHAVSAKLSRIKLHIKLTFRNNACRTCVAGILLPHNESASTSGDVPLTLDQG